MKQKSISTRAAAVSGANALLVFGAIFLVGGALTAYVIVKPHYYHWSRNAQPPPAVYVALVPLIMAAAGAWMMFYSTLLRKRPRTTPPQPETVDLVETITLKPEQSSLAVFIVMTLFTVFWNGFVAFAAINSWTQTKIISFFLLPFMAVGMFLIAIVVYTLLKLFNPRPSLRITPGAIPLGANADLEYALSGAVDRIGTFRIWLEAVEEAKYQQGTDTITKRSVFERIPLFETVTASEMRAGTLHFQIPEFTMHSFESPHNKITWFVKVTGDIPRWPDIDEAFPIRIRPLPPLQG